MRALQCLAILALAGSALREPMRGGMVGVPATEPAIRAVANGYVSAVLSGDARGAAAVYREDAVEMVPGEPPIRGRAAIEQHYRGLFESPVRITSFTLEPSDTRIAGDVAFDVGAYRRVVTPGPGAPPCEDRGKYLVVLKRKGPSWEVAYLIYNSDLPAPAPVPGR